jgi:5-methylcytosine-specific restriction endonuclease McrA
MNSRISAKERNLIKGAIRRVFSRSEMRRKVLDKSVLLCYSDPRRPKVKTWCKCALCGQPEAKSYMEVDHISPIIPVDSTLESMSWDEVINRTWCDENNLQVVCPPCHKEKTRAESKQRTKNKKGKQKHE